MKIRVIWVYKNKELCETIMPARPEDYDTKVPVDIFGEKYLILKYKKVSVPKTLRKLGQPKDVYYVDVKKVGDK